MSECNKSTLADCRLIELDTHGDASTGKLSVIDDGIVSGFATKRVYFIYDVPEGMSRGNHAHRSLDQIMVAIHGSFDIVLDDGRHKRVYHMDTPSRGLLVVPGIWRVLEHFSPGAVCMVIASDKYEEADYIRLYDDFLKMKF